MDKNVNKENTTGEDKPNVTPGIIRSAHTEAEKDMKKDPEFNEKPDPADDLDEGELARLEGSE